MKKIFSLFVLIFMCVITLSACKDNKIDRSAVVAPTDDVIMTIFTYDGRGESMYGLTNLGHSFLTFENMSEDAITVGDKQVAPNETIAVGLWSIKAHFGVWYNVESNYIYDYNKYDGRISVSIGITLDDTEKINNYIATHDYWTPIHNCSNFALNMWNLVATDNEALDTPFIYTPTKVAKQLKTFASCEINKEINTEHKFGYYNGTTPVYYELEKEV